MATSLLLLYYSSCTTTIYIIYIKEGKGYTPYTPTDKAKQTERLGM